MVLYFSGMIYKYYSVIGCFTIKHNEEGKDILNKIFNNIPYFIKNRLRVNFLQDGFVVYNDKVPIIKKELIPPIPEYMIPVDLCQKNKPVNDFTTYNMTSKFDFSKNKMDALYLTEIMRTDWL